MATPRVHADRVRNTRDGAMSTSQRGGATDPPPAARDQAGGGAGSSRARTTMSCSAPSPVDWRWSTASRWKPWRSNSPRPLSLDAMISTPSLPSRATGEAEPLSTKPAPTPAPRALGARRRGSRRRGSSSRAAAPPSRGRPVGAAWRPATRWRRQRPPGDGDVESRKRSRKPRSRSGIRPERREARGRRQRAVRQRHRRRPRQVHRSPRRARGRRLNATSPPGALDGS